MKSSRAIVVGGGVGGLAAAAVLARHCGEVVLLEKDPLDASTLGRKGVNQGQHLHSLLVGAELLLGRLFPGFRSDLLAAGAVVLRAGLDQQIFEAGRWMPERDLGLTILAQTRGLLERQLRLRVVEIPGVQIRSGVKVTGLSFPSEGRVRVDLVKRGGAGGGDETEEASLLVDASGRSGALLRMLEGAVGVRVPVEEVASRIAYVSGLLDKPAGHRERTENILIVPEPNRPAGGALLDVEGDRWTVSLHGRRGLVPPTEQGAWKAYARELPDPRIAERIAEASLVAPLAAYNKPTSTFRRFDQAQGLPATYLPLGDVISSVNPIFGQGMAVAFGHADALGEVLNEGMQDCARRYLSRAVSWSAKAWRRASTYDRMFLGSDESDVRELRALTSLAKARSEKAFSDPAVHRALVLEGQMIPAWAKP